MISGSSSVLNVNADQAPRSSNCALSATATTIQIWLLLN
jgi:hypothetical protein